MPGELPSTRLSPIADFRSRPQYVKSQDVFGNVSKASPVKGLDGYTPRVSQHTPGQAVTNHHPYIPWFLKLTISLSYFLVFRVCAIRDWFDRLVSNKLDGYQASNGYAPIVGDWESFYSRHFTFRLIECFCSPTHGRPARFLNQLMREARPDGKFVLTGEQSRLINVATYDYLGFADTFNPFEGFVADVIRDYGAGTCGPRRSGGTLDLHKQAEQLAARFIGTEAAVVIGAGFSTNSTIIPAVVGPGSLIISDELAHVSMRLGIKNSRAAFKNFRNNDMVHLEQILREVIPKGQPDGKPWKNILVAVEGLYSMDGTIVDLPGLLALKKKYKFYIYMDEAHSVGAIGPHGRGATDYFNVDPSEIDVLMGTFSKSFAAAGGYVAGSKAMVDRLRFRGAAETYAESIGPAVLAQIICAMSTMLNIPTPRGVLPYDASVKHTELTFSSPVVNPKFVQDHIHRVVFNSRYLRYGLLKLGFAVDGHAASPVVPLLIFGPGPWLPFRRLMRDRKIPVACVVVGYPATKLNRVRVRFCVSAKQTKEDIDEVLRACDEVGDVLGIRHGIVRGKDRWPIQRVTSSAIELVDTSFEESG